jgi:hypothetical protein
MNPPLNEKLFRKAKYQIISLIPLTYPIKRLVHIMTIAARLSIGRQFQK